MDRLRLPKILTLDEIKNLLSELGDKTQVVFFGASDRVFCGGADLKFMIESSASEIESYFQQLKNLILKIKSLDFSACFVDGFAAGGGLGIISACDLVFGGQKSLFVLPEIKLGFGPFFVSVLLKRRMKLSFLKELAVTCEKKDAAWAKQAGLIDILVENEVEVASFLDNHSSNLVVFLKSLRSNDPELIADFEVRIKEVVAFLSLPETKDKLKKYLEEISKSA